MSKEAIKRIKEAETEADRIRKEGAERAKEKLRLAEEEGARLCKETEERAIRENREKLEMTQKKADELLARTETQARAAAAKMRADGEDRMRDAVRMIVGGLNQKWQ